MTTLSTIKSCESDNTQPKTNENIDIKPTFSWLKPTQLLLPVSVDIVGFRWRSEEAKTLIQWLIKGHNAINQLQTTTKPKICSSNNSWKVALQAEQCATCGLKWESKFATWMVKKLTCQKSWNCFWRFDIDFSRLI